MLLFLGIFLIVCHPIGWAMLMLAIAALVVFAVMPAWLAAAVMLVLAVSLMGRAVVEMQARRAWQRDDETLRRAAVRRARRYLDDGS